MDFETLWTFLLAVSSQDWTNNLLRYFELDLVWTLIFDRTKGSQIPRHKDLHQDVAAAKAANLQLVGGDKGSVCSPYLLTPFPLGFCQ